MDFEPYFDNDSYRWDGFGTELASYFHPHMFTCHKKGKMSPLDFFNSDEDLRRGIWKLIALYPDIKLYNIREICSNEDASSRINNFPPRVMICILKHLYNNQKITMLDPCAGFSGRLVGSFASKIVHKYIGIDLSEPTYNGLLKTQKWLSETNENKDFSAQIIKGSCLEANISEEVDFVFTSPPFLDEEEYVGVNIETDYNKWKTNFIEPFIKTSYNALKNGGKLSVYTEEIRRNNFPNDFKNIALDLGFKQLNDVYFRVPARENLRKERVTRAVKIIVFEKYL